MSKRENTDYWCYRIYRISFDRISGTKRIQCSLFDRYNPNNDHGWLKNSIYKKDFEIVLGDVRDYDSVYKVMKKCKSVMHLAALIGILYSYESPFLAYVKTNIEGTYNVLEASKNLDLENIIITSTSEIYGTPKKLPIKEDFPVNSQSPYAATKAAADQLSLSYYKSFDLPIKLIRPLTHMDQDNLIEQ